MFDNQLSGELLASRQKGVDTAPKSSGGSVPTKETRPVTSGDIMEMFKAHAEKRAREAA